MKLLKIILLCLTLLCFSYAKEKKPININIDNLSKQAQKEFKHTLVFFNMTHCPYCKEMDKFTLKNKDVEQQIKKNFIFIDNNIDDDDTIQYKNFFDTKREFAKYLKINFYPTVVFIDETNTIVYRVTGYKRKKIFLNILSYIKTKSYVDTTLNSYINRLKLKK